MSKSNPIIPETDLSTIDLTETSEKIRNIITELELGNNVNQDLDVAVERLREAEDIIDHLLINNA